MIAQTKGRWEEVLKNKLAEQSEFKLLPANQLSNYKKEENLAGLWVDPDAKFLQAEHLIDNIQICPNREGMVAALPAPNHAIVAHVQNGYNYREFIVHISAQGEILKHLDIRYSFGLVGMLAPDLVLVARSTQQNDELVQWDLQTYDKITLACPSIIFKAQTTFYKQPEIFLFDQAKVFCYCWCTTHRNQINLAYYRYPLKSNEDQPLLVTQIKLPSNYENFRFAKINKKSMVGWIPIKSQQTEFISIVTYQLEDNLMQNLQIPLSLVSFTKGSQRVLVSDIWELSSGVLFLQLSVVQMDKYNQVTKITSQNDFIWNWKEGTFRRTNFHIQEEHQVQVLGQFRKVYKIAKSRYLAQQREISTTYYIDMLTEKVMAIQKIEPTVSIEDRIQAYLEFSPQLQYCFLEAGERSVHRKRVRVRKVDWPKISMDLVATFLLTSLIDECEDDLIFEAIRLTEAGQEQNT